MMYVPVLDLNNQQLMPTTQWRAERWIMSRKATPFWKKGVFCVRLNVKTGDVKQEIAVGIDPGSKKEAYTIKSEVHTYLNIQADAVTWVKDAIESRRNARKARRYRKTPYRQRRFNRSKGGLAPSTKARWQWKLRIINWLKKMFPITHTVVEDIKAKSKGQKKWDTSFSPLEVGKKWFYSQLDNLTLKEGWETKELRELRDSAGLGKTKNKLSKSFDAHCVDSWVLASYIVGGHLVPDNKSILYIRPLRFHRRQLHVFRPSKGGIRKSYGSTISIGLKRGSLVKHNKLGLTYVGGTSNNRISLHKLDGIRVSRNTKIEDCKFLCFNSWTINKTV